MTLTFKTKKHLEMGLPIGAVSPIDFGKQQGGQIFRVIKSEDLARHLTHAEHGETFASNWCGNFYFVPERWAKAEEVQNER